VMEPVTSSVTSSALKSPILQVKVWRPRVWTSRAVKFTTISMEGVRRIIDGMFDASVVMDARRFCLGLPTDSTRAMVGSMCCFVVPAEDKRENSETMPPDSTRVRVLSARLGMLAALMLDAESVSGRVRFKLPGLAMRGLSDSCLELVLQRAARGVSVTSLLDDDATVRTKRGPTTPLRSFAVAMFKVCRYLVGCGRYDVQTFRLVRTSNLFLLSSDIVSVLQSLSKT
jgi:hypothetical protein